MPVPAALLDVAHQRNGHGPAPSHEVQTGPSRAADRAIEAPWARPAETVAHALGVDVELGLSAAEAARRLVQHGPNRLRVAPPRPAWRVLVDQVRSLIVGLLVVAAAVSIAAGQTAEAAAVGAVVALTVGIGFATELRAVRSMEALAALGRASARVRRDGQVRVVPAEGLVPGDVVLVDSGDVVAADLRLVRASRLQADESALTGESVPVEKGPAPVAPSAPLSERTPMLHRGTAVPRGSGLGVVVATGAATEVGAIAELVTIVEKGATPLDRQLAALGRGLIGATFAVAAAVAAVGVASGRDPLLMVQTGIALAVAAVPEGLPVVATLALARGVRRMARQRALLRRLSAVETLGSTAVVITDKTGTLTENRMAVACLALEGGDVEVASDAFLRDGRPVTVVADAGLWAALEAAVLCNDAALSLDGHPDGGTGDPMERALLALAARAGLDRDRLAERRPRVREEAFDPDVRMMATVHRAGPDGYVVAVKGAPGTVLDACARVLGPDGTDRPLDSAGRESWLERNRAMAHAGLRVLALATKTTPVADGTPYHGLTLVGLVGLADPPRAGVREALAACRAAGIDVVMATGDQPATALGVARAVGLSDGADDAGGGAVTGAAFDEARAGDEGARGRLLAATVFARMSPRQKLALLALHQRAGRVVAVTGDGVNDAPALRAADIGVAMGQCGTDVAREAADMVLLDDAFGTIVEAVREGRAVFGNVRRFVVYLLSCNASEVLVVGAATALGLPLPLLPLQILFLNLVTDVFPALALGVGRAPDDVMDRPPRPAGAPILERRHWAAVGAYGALLTASVLGAQWAAVAGLGLTHADAVTVSFLALAVGQLGHVVNVRAPGAGLVRNEVTRNPAVWAALALCAALLGAAVYVLPVAAVLDLAPPSAAAWGLVLAAGLAPVAVGALGHAAVRRVRLRAARSSPSP